MADLGSEWIVVNVNEQCYGLSARCVLELQDCSGVDLVAFPGCEPPVVGLLEHRDRVLPVVDLRLMLGDPPREGDASKQRPRLAIAQHGRCFGAFLVDGVHTMVIIEPEQIQPLDRGVSLSDEILGVHSFERFGEVILIDAGACLAQLEAAIPKSRRAAA